MERELELKLELTPEDLSRLRADAGLRALTVGRPTSRLLRSTYFDTGDGALFHNGLTLRVRRSGKRWVQTVKQGTRVSGGVSHPVEIESEIGGPDPDLKALPKTQIRKRIRRLVKDGELAPVFKTEVRRTARNLAMGEGASAELAIDTGAIHASDASEDLSEVELELKSGDASDLLHVAETLFSNAPVRFCAAGKAERGYRLLNGSGEEATRECAKSLERLAPDQSCADAFSTTCRRLVDAIFVQWKAVLESDDAEGPHKLRVALRRLRTAIRVFRPAIDSLSLRRLERDARDLARVVGTLRDADVVASDIVAPVVARSADSIGFRELEELVQTERDKRRSAVREELSDASWTRLKLRLALLPEGAGWRSSVTDAGSDAIALDDLARGALRKQWRRVCRRARRFDRMSVKERHELRKELKTLRYAVEIFSPLFPRADVKRFMRQLKSLQDRFGYLNDVATANRLHELVDAAAATDTSLQRAVGYTVGWHAARAEAAWQDVKACWLSLEKKGPIWT